MMHLAMKATLRQIAEVRAGHPFRGAIEASTEGNGYVIQTRDQHSDGQIVWDQLVRAEVGGRGEPEWLKNGDVIFSARGSRHLASVMTEVDRPTVCSPHFFVIKVKIAQMLPEFLAWQLNQQPAQRFFQSTAEGSAQVSIRITMLEEIELAIPSIEAQRQVVQLANAAFKEKQLLNNLIQNRQRQMAAIAADVLR